MKVTLKIIITELILCWYPIHNHCRLCNMKTTLFSPCWVDRLPLVSFNQGSILRGMPVEISLNFDLRVNETCSYQAENLTKQTSALSFSSKQRLTRTKVFKQRSFLGLPGTVGCYWLKRVPSVPALSAIAAGKLSHQAEGAKSEQKYLAADLHYEVASEDPLIASKQSEDGFSKNVGHIVY